MVEFDLTDEIRQLGVSKVFATETNIYVYNGKAFAQSAYYKKELQKTVDKLKSQMVYCGHFGDAKAVDKIILLLSRIWVAAEEEKERASNDNEKSKSGKNRPLLVYKYSNNKRGDLHESVILGGKPVFLKCDDNGLITRIEQIKEETRNIKSPHIQHYPYEPYEFENMKEVLSYVERAKNETIDSLYKHAKQITEDYNDQKKEKVILLAIDIIWSYFQDKFPTTHYDIVLGGNGSGKSSYGITFAATAYRVVKLTSPNAANINRILGCIEVGQCTLVSDETGAIDKSEDLMSLLKDGYDSKGKTSKVNDFTRDPEFFHAYCFKMIISERMPNLRDARGVLDRSFTFSAYKGKPKYDIKETLEPQGNAARQERLDALNDFKKLMLIYRLLHFKDPIPDINVAVEGREKELSKPIIQLFYNTEAQKEVEETLQYWLNLRNEKKEITLEPILHPIITKLVSACGNEISVKQIWWAIKETIEGYIDPDNKRPNEYQTLEYGTIYNNTISNILEHTFGGRPKHKEHGNVFLFDPEELARVGRAYTLSTNIQTKIVTEDDHEGSEGNEGYTEEPPNYENNNEDNGSPSTEPSEPSDPSAKVLEEYSCRYCEFKTKIHARYDEHTVTKHSRRPGY
jgi:hypothetical protein